MSDLSDVVTERILGSGRVRILAPTAEDFDFILLQSLSSNRQTINDRQTLHVTMQMKLLARDRELLGQWSDDIEQSE